MLLTLKQLDDCQGAVSRAGAMSIPPEKAAMAFRMSKNIENLTKSSDLRDFQRHKLRLLQKYGKERKDKDGGSTGVYDVETDNNDAYYVALDKLEAETVEIRIRPIDFVEYLNAIGPTQKIFPVDIAALAFIFQFPADFDDGEDDKQSEK